MTRHRYGISALVSQTSFRGETSGGVSECRLFSQATMSVALYVDKPGLSSCDVIMSGICPLLSADPNIFIMSTFAVTLNKIIIKELAINE